MRDSSSLWAAVVLVACAGNAARAAILTFAMEGTVSYIEDPSGAMGFAAIGDRVVYTFTFDSEAPDESAAPTLGQYSFLSSSLSVGDDVIPSSPRVFSIGHPLDIVSVLSNLTIDGLTTPFVRFRLNDQAQSDALTDTLLPLVPYNLELFESKSFLIQGFGPVIPPDQYPTISVSGGPIDSFYIVPEPSSLLFLFLLFVAARR